MDERFTFFSVDVEISNRCDVGCRMCGRDSLSRPRGLMAQVTFSRIVEALCQIKSRIILCGLGNPVSNPLWADFIGQYKEVGGKIGMVIHGTHLSEKTRERLLEVQPSFLEISFPSVDERHFRYLSPGGRYSEAHRAVISLAEAEQRRFPIAMIGVSTGVNPDEEERSRNHWQSHGLQSRVFSCHSRGGSIAGSRLITSPLKRSPDAICGLFARHAFVTWEGLLLACCHDLTGQTALGDFNGDTLETLLSRKARHVDEVNPFSICAVCDDPYRLLEQPRIPYPENERGRRKVLRNLKWKMKIDGG